jgi:hypothetical protein
MRFLLFYAVAATAIALLMGRSNWLSYYRLFHEGIVTQALVTKTDCADHATFSYRFAVGGQSIDGRGGDGNGNPPCGALKLGDSVQVVYLAAAPRTNLPGNPQERLVNETAVIATAALVLPLLALVILFLVVRRRQKG